MVRFIQSNDHAGIVLRVTVGYPLKEGTLIDFYHACSSPIESVLLQPHIEKAIAGTMEEIRRVSYQRGWRAAKSKKVKKSDWFPSLTQVQEWEKKEAGPS